jgi:mycobactin lysine-N-oxygenase
VQELKSENNPATLLVLGAGPKGISIAAKHWVLKHLGYPVPKLVVIEKQAVTAHWSGDYGYTDGRRILGTPPHKDVGFPYAATCWDEAGANKAVNAAMLVLSWPAYLIEQYRYSDWVDRGRPGPTHQEWSKYLQWVAERIELPLQSAEVYHIGITPDGRRWQLSCKAPQGQEQKVSPPAEFQLEGDGLVITGPGTPLNLPGQPAQHPRILDGASFWSNLTKFSELPKVSSKGRPLSVGVIGTGETAAAIVVALTEVLHDQVLIEVVTSKGVIYARDESYQENHVFSDPDALWIDLAKRHKRAAHDSRLPHSLTHHFKWSNLTEADRREFLSRTDRGVFSMQAMQAVNLAENVSPLTGSARQVIAGDEQVIVELEYNGEVRKASYDYLVVAIGFNPRWFVELMDESLQTKLTPEVSPSVELENFIGYDLAVQAFQPKLHLPMLAGLAQGPGFPNLSCLGLLSDRILRSYTAHKE